MIFKYTSVQEVMGRVLRSVGGKLPGHYFQSMLEWLPEGIRQLETKYQLVTASTGNSNGFCTDTGEGGPADPDAIITKNHVAPLPRDLITLLAVEDCRGNRMRTLSDITDTKNQTNRFSSQGGDDINGRATNFQVDVEQLGGADPGAEGAIPGEAIPWDGSDIEKSPENSNSAWGYKIQGNMVQTSLQCMFVKLHYLTLQKDADGYLLIPDVDEYKAALTNYVLRELIGAGFHHAIWNGPPGWNHWNVQWEKMAARALGKIKYPTQDRMEALRVGFAERLIPPRHFYEDFFVGAEQTQEIHQI